MRQSPNLKRPRIIVIGLLALSLLPVSAMYGQAANHTKTWGSFLRQGQSIPAPTGNPNQVSLAAIVGPFLPVVLMSTRVTPLVFTGSATADCQGTTGVSFTYGIQYLCVDTIVDGAQGQAYRFRWTIDGRLIDEDELGASGTIGSQLVNVPDGICYGLKGACGDAIPRGTYQVSFFLNNVQYQTAAAVIR